MKLTNKIYNRYNRNLKSAKDEFFFALEDELSNAIIDYEYENDGQLSREETKEVYKANLQWIYSELVAEMGDTLREIYRLETGKDELEL